MKNYYDLLGVEPNAKLEEIKSAYKYLAKKFHPDKNPGDDKAAKYFLDIQEAYECLSDVNRRKAYDTAYGAWSERKGSGNNQQRTVDEEKQVEKFATLLKKLRKNYFIIAGIFSTLIAFGLFMSPDSGFGKLSWLLPFIAAGVIFIVLHIYFLPSMISYGNCHEYRKEIFILNCFSIFANLLTPLTFIIFFVCLVIYAQNKVKGINMIFLAIIGVLLSGMSAKHEHEKKKW